MTTLDFLVFLPIIPALPVIATWWLPWEGWITRKVPKRMLGPYLIYCAFAAWYFKLPWLVVFSAAFLGIGVSVYALVKPKSEPSKEKQ